MFFIKIKFTCNEPLNNQIKKNGMIMPHTSFGVNLFSIVCLNVKEILARSMAPYLMFKWQQRDLNPQPLCSKTNTLTASFAKWLSIPLRTKWLCGFVSRCYHLNFRYGSCFGQNVPWHSGKLKSEDSLWNLYVTW